MAHARRKFHELHVHQQSPAGEKALAIIQQLYEVERDAATLDPPARQALRQVSSRPIADALQQWLLQQRAKVPNGTATAKAIDNNWVENQIRPIALERKNWLFAGSLRAGQRAAAVMSLMHSARLNGHDPYAYLKDVLTRLPTQLNSRIEDLLPHRWKPADAMA